MEIRGSTPYSRSHFNNLRRIKAREKKILALFWRPKAVNIVSKYVDNAHVLCTFKIRLIRKVLTCIRMYVIFLVAAVYMYRYIQYDNYAYTLCMGISLCEHKKSLKVFLRGGWIF